MNVQRPLFGLSAAEAQRRLRTHGPNALLEKHPEALWRRFILKDCEMRPPNIRFQPARLPR